MTMTWTDERIEQLRHLWVQGKTASEIAKSLGDITRNAVIGKAHRLGLSGRPSPIKKREVPARVATILSLSERMCKWPEGDPRSATFHFCGRPSQPGMPYCCDHAAIAYQPAKKRDDDRRSGVA